MSSKDKEKHDTAMAVSTPKADEVATIQKSELPSRLRNRAPEAQQEGFENVNPNDVIMPRMALCQAASDERKRGNSKYIPGLEDGQFFNTLTKEIYGSKLLVVPVHHYKTRILWKGKTPGSGMRCRSSDFVHGMGDPGGECVDPLTGEVKCPFAKWLPETERDDKNPSGHPECNDFWNFPVLVLDKNTKTTDMSTMIILSFKSIGINAAKTLISLGRFRPGKPSIYDCVYELTSRADTRDAGDSYQPVITNPDVELRWASDEVAEIGKMCHDIVVEAQKAGRLKFDEEGTRDNGAGDSTAGRSTVDMPSNMREPGDEPEEEFPTN